MTKVSSTNLSHGWGCGAEVRALTLDSSINRLAVRGLMGDPWQHHGPVLILALEEEVCVSEAKPRSMIICGMDMLVLCERSGSCCNFCLTMLMEGSTGTKVKRALTS